MTYTVFKFPFGIPDSDTMRKHGRDLSFDEQAVFYYKGYVGFEALKHTDLPDPAMESVATSFETATGVRPEIVEVLEPTSEQ